MGILSFITTRVCTCMSVIAGVLLVAMMGVTFADVMMRTFGRPASRHLRAGLPSGGRPWPV